MDHEGINDLFTRRLGDARLRQFRWDDVAVILELRLPANPTKAVPLRFENVSRLRIDLDYGEFSGEPLLYEAAVNAVGQDRWAVRLDFGVAPDGHISFECERIETSSSEMMRPNGP